MWGKGEEKMEKNRQNENLIVRLTFEFAIDVIMYCEQLEKERKYILAKQLGKAGTSIGANIREAQNAESRPDFIHKMKIAAKEADETEYWVNLCSAIPGYPNPSILFEQLESISKIINKIISSSKTK